MNKSIHDFKVTDLEGKEVQLDQYAGKVVMIVNTASKCGFTPQLFDLEELYQEYRDQGFEVLAFPSNDFAGQEPLEGKDIEQFCMTNYNTEFPIFDKVHVKGSKADELFQFLGDKKQNGQVSAKPKWNFHKYLVDKEGQVVDYFLPITKPTSGKVKRSIEKLLSK
jgi:glutathione peroxidase